MKFDSKKDPPVKETETFRLMPERLRTLLKQVYPIAERICSPVKINMCMTASYMILPY